MTPVTPAQTHTPLAPPCICSLNSTLLYSPPPAIINSKGQTWEASALARSLPASHYCYKRAVKPSLPTPPDVSG